MRPAENINELIKKLQLKASADLDRRVHEDISRALAESRKTESAPPKPNMWRTIMKSSITKIAAAAVIIIACVIGLSLWRTTSSGVALADVLTRIEQVKGYTYQISSTMTRQKTTSRWTSNILISNEYGIKMAVISVDPNSIQNKPHSHTVGDETYLLPRLSSLIFVNHKEKTYDRYIYDGVELEDYKQEYNEPHTIIKQILNCKHTSLGQSILDGITTEGFQTTDIAYQGGFFGQAELEGEHEKVNVKLWVDVNTFLPVRLEEDIVTEKGTHIHEVSYDFRWNVIINPDDFEPNIPEEYRSLSGDIVIKPFDEENTLQSFRLWTDTFGKYPENLTPEKFGQEYMTNLGLDPNSMKDMYQDMSDEERTKKTSEMMQTIAPVLLYNSLIEENKEPVYYGKTVELGDADKVLMRWKLEEGLYRVIFGDLSVKTVTSEELAELEKP